MRSPHLPRAGYTLVELLLAMSLFAALATGLVALLARSAEFLTVGASQTETMDTLQTFADAFAADVSEMASRPDSETGRPDVRIFSDWVGCDVDGDRRPDATVQRLFFVRSIRNDVGSVAGQRSGIEVGGKEYLDQIHDAKSVADGKLKASGGLMEVFWTAIPEQKADAAVMQIWRGFRAPIGGPKSLLPAKWWHDSTANQTERGPIDAIDVKAVAKPLLSGVLYFGVEFWSRRTNTWDDKVRAKDGGPYRTWDSTRGILPAGSGDVADLEGFYLSKKKNPSDTTSVDDPTDDTFPRKLRVTCVVEEMGRNARVGYLDGDLTVDGKSIQVSDTRFFPATETAQRYVKIEGEWIEVGLPSNGVMPVVRRGVRGTTAAKHDVGVRIHHGRTFVAEHDVATFRDAYRYELATGGRNSGYGR